MKPTFLSFLLSISVCFLHVFALQTYAQAELTIKRTPAITVTLTGPSGEYQIQRAQVLTNWVIHTNVTLSGSPFVFYVAAGSSQQFYQAIQKLLPNNPNPQLLVWTSPGKFVMGSPLGEADMSIDESPQTQVTITKGFWMSKYEVTQREYQAIMGKNPSYFIGDDNPVEMVSWMEAVQYCNQLTIQEQKAGRLPLGYEYRLPTEAEWEYACRAGTTTRYSFGNDAVYTQLNKYVWYVDNSNGTTHPVGSKLPNPWGLYDMHGNVWEWCLGFYGAYPGGNVTDYIGASSGTRVMRGGDWSRDGRGCRSADRATEYWPDMRAANFGFRPVLAPSQ